MAFESARLIDAVIFDKTGTLTLGRFGVEEVVPFGDSTRDEILSLAGSIEELSEHPIARAIAATADSRSVVEDFKAIPGKGAEGRIDGNMIAVVSPGYLSEAGIETPVGVGDLSSGGRTVVFVLRGGSPIGVISLSDIVRPESTEAVRRLKEMGIEPIMLTGVNDAPSLATADVGIAIGAGTDVAVATADVVLVRSDPNDIPKLISLARATYGKMVQNLAWATGYNVVAIPLAAGVLAGAGILLTPAAPWRRSFDMAHELFHLLTWDSMNSAIESD